MVENYKVQEFRSKEIIKDYPHYVFLISLFCSQKHMQPSLSPKLNHKIKWHRGFFFLVYKICSVQAYLFYAVQSLCPLPTEPQSKYNCFQEAEILPIKMRLDSVTTQNCNALQWCLSCHFIEHYLSH